MLIQFVDLGAFFNNLNTAFQKFGHQTVPIDPGINDIIKADWYNEYVTILGNMYNGSLYIQRDAQIPAAYGAEQVSTNAKILEASYHGLEDCAGVYASVCIYEPCSCDIYEPCTYCTCWHPCNTYACDCDTVHAFPCSCGIN